MIRGLTQVSWERVDVCFHKSWLRYNAHHNIQVRFDHYWKKLLNYSSTVGPAFVCLTNCGFILQLVHQLGIELLSMQHFTCWADEEESYAPFLLLLYLISSRGLWAFLSIYAMFPFSILIDMTSLRYLMS
jgi:hypothetical protein